MSGSFFMSAFSSLEGLNLEALSFLTQSGKAITYGCG